MSYALLTHAERQSAVTVLHHTCSNSAFPLRAVGGSATSYAIRSKAAVLLALVTKRQGGQLLQALLPELLRLAAEGATQAEMVSCSDCTHCCAHTHITLQAHAAVTDNNAQYNSHSLQLLHYMAALAAVATGLSCYMYGQHSKMSACTAVCTGVYSIAYDGRGGHTVQR